MDKTSSEFKSLLIKHTENKRAKSTRLATLINERFGHISGLGKVDRERVIDAIDNWLYRPNHPEPWQWPLLVALAVVLELSEKEMNEFLQAAGHKNWKLLLDQANHQELFAPWTTNTPTKTIEEIRTGQEEIKANQERILQSNDHLHLSLTEISESLLPQPLPGHLAAAEARYRDQVVAIYNTLHLSGLGTTDLLFGEIPLEKIFVHLTFTVERQVQEPAQLEKSTQGRKPKERQRITTVQEPIPLAEALKHHLIVVGEPGAGKSTLLRWLAVTFAQKCQKEPERLGPMADTDRFPILVELARLPRQFLSLEGGETPNWLQILPQFITSQQGFDTIPSHLIAQALQGGHCLLLLDGLDEVPHQQVRLRLMRSLAELARLNSHNRLILGSRPTAVIENEGVLLSQFKRCQIERFALEDIERFFLLWYDQNTPSSSGVQPIEATRLFEYIEARPHLFQLAGTPLLSTLLLLIWRKDGSLPEQRVNLYQRCCQMFLEHWEPHHDVPSPNIISQLPWEEQFSLLASLAYAIHQQEQRNDISRPALVTWLAQNLLEKRLCIQPSAARLEAEQFLTSLGTRSGLMQYMGNDRFGFPHLTFQEYLAAQYIASQNNYLELVMEHLHEGWWEEVHVLTIGVLGSTRKNAPRARALITTILNAYRPPHPFFRSSGNTFLNFITLGGYLSWIQYDRHISWILAKELLLAVKGYRECQPGALAFDLETELTHRATSFIWCVFADHDRYRLQQTTVRELCALLPDSHTILLSLLQEKKREVRASAADMLGQMGNGNQQAIDALLLTLHDPHWEVRINGVNSLAQIGKGNAKVTQALLRVLREKRSSDDLGIVKFSAARHLGELGVGNEEVVEVLLRALEDEDSDGGIRRAAITSLGQLVKNKGSREVIAALLQALYDEDRQVKEAALQSLGQLGDGSQEVVEAILQVSGSMQKEAVKSLNLLGSDNSRIETHLLQALHDEDSQRRMTAASCLGMLGVGNPKVAEALLLALQNDDDFSVRIQIVESLGQIGKGDQRVLLALLQTLHDSDTLVHTAAVKSLGQLGVSNQYVLETLLHTHHDDPIMSDFPLWTLQETLNQLEDGDEQVLKVLLRTLRDDNPATRKVAAYCLGRLTSGTQQSVEALLRALHDSNAFVRIQIVKSLGQIGVGNQKATEALLQAFQDDDDEVRRAVVESLGQIGTGNEEAIQVLIDLLQEGDRWLRRAVVESLGQIGAGNERVVSALLAALRGDWFVREAVCNSLEQIGKGNERVIKALAHVFLQELRSQRKTAMSRLAEVAIQEPQVFSQVLVTLNGFLYNDFAREAALTLIQRLLLGRPLPKYYWRPYKKRRFNLRISIVI